MTKLFAMRTFRLEKKPGRLTRSATSLHCGRMGSALGVALSIVALLIARPTAAAFVNFSQSNEVVTPSSADSRRLSKYFTPPYRLGPLPPEVSEILLRSAGPQLDRACATMIDSWGANVRGSARVSLRILAVAGGNAWVAYRCDSRLPQYENEYSERLAIFSAKRGGLQFIDLAAADDTRATLYHVALANVLKLIGAENSAAFELFAVNSTPVDGKANRSTRDWSPKTVTSSSPIPRRRPKSPCRWSLRAYDPVQIIGQVPAALTTMPVSSPAPDCASVTIAPVT